jgi:hypothetical protein
MNYKARNSKTQKTAIAEKEMKACKDFMGDIGPSYSPTIRIYRLDHRKKQDGTPFRKQTRIDEVLLSEFKHDPILILEYLRREFGSGTFLLRFVRSNGKYGGSRVVSVE